MKNVWKKISEKYNTFPVSVKATFWFFFCNVVQKGLSVITVPIVTRMLSTAEYGIYSVFCSYSEILVIFCTLRLFGNGYYVGLKHYKDDKSRYTSCIACLMIFLTSLLFTLYLLFRDRMFQMTGLNFQQCLLLFVWVYCQGAIGLWLAENRAEFKYRQIVAATMFIAVSTPVLKITLISIFASSGMDLSLAAILGLVLPNVAVAILAWISIFRNGRCVFSKDYWVFALRFNIPLIPFYLSQTMLNQADRIMIERMDSASSAGIYSVAYSLAMTVSVVNSALESSYVPWEFNKIRSGEQKIVADALNVALMFVSGLHLILIALAPEIMRIFATKEYVEAIYVVPPVTMGILMQFIASVFSNIEFYYERSKLVAVSSVLSAVANVILNFIAIPHFGYLAAGYTTLICYFANMVFHGFMAYRIVNQEKEEMPVDVNGVIVLVFLSIALMFVFLFTYKHMFLRWGLLLVFIISIVIYRRRLFLAIQTILREKNG